MKILAISTSTDMQIIGLVDEGELVSEINIKSGRNHETTLMDNVEKVLNEAAIDLNEIDLFAVDQGPGSYTGIRIGMAPMIIWSEFLNKPLVGVTSLESLLDNQEMGQTDYLISGIDAKRNNAFMMLKKVTQNTSKLLHGSVPGVLNELQDKKITFVSNNTNISDTNKENYPEVNFVVKPIDITKIAKIATQKFLIEGAQAKVKPIYLRKTQAEAQLNQIVTSDNFVQRVD